MTSPGTPLVNHEEQRGFFRDETEGEERMTEMKRQRHCMKRESCREAKVEARKKTWTPGTCVERGIRVWDTCSDKPWQNTQGCVTTYIFSLNLTKENSFKTHHVHSQTTCDSPSFVGFLHADGAQLFHNGHSLRVTQPTAVTSVSVSSLKMKVSGFCSCIMRK